MRYLVRALDAQHQLVSLGIEALDERDVHRQLAMRSLTPVSVSSGRGSLTARPMKFGLLLFAQELHALLVAGLSVVEALEVLIDKEASGPVRSALLRLAEHLREGRSLSRAMAQQPAVFPALFIGILQAAEGTSDLPLALSRYIGYETRLNAIRQKLVSSAIYPAILLTVGGGVALFLLGYVVPRFSTVYQSSGRTLPWASRMLLDWGQFAAQHGVVLLVVGGLAAVTLWWRARRRLRRGDVWQFMALLPGMRPKLEILELSRLYLTLGMLLEGGLPLSAALNLARSVLGPQRQQRVDEVIRQIEEGGTLTAAFVSAQLITPVALRLLKVGERSGQLGPMLSRTAEFYEGDIARWIDRFTKAFEPILMAAIGLVIGLIVILLYMPIFDLAGSLQQ